MDWKRRLARLDRAVLGNAVPTPERFFGALLTLALVAVAVLAALSIVTALVSGSFGPLLPAIAFAALAVFLLLRDRRKRSSRPGG